MHPVSAGCGFISPEMGRRVSGGVGSASWRRLFESGLRFKTPPFSDVESFPEGDGALIVDGTVSWGCSRSSRNGRGRLGDESTDSLNKRLSGSGLWNSTLGFGEATPLWGCLCSQSGTNRKSWSLLHWMVLNLKAPWSYFSDTHSVFCYIPKTDTKKIFEQKSALAETFVDRP